MWDEGRWFKGVKVGSWLKSMSDQTLIYVPEVKDVLVALIAGRLRDQWLKVLLGLFSTIVNFHISVTLNREYLACFIEGTLIFNPSLFYTNFPFPDR